MYFRISTNYLVWTFSDQQTHHDGSKHIHYDENKYTHHDDYKHTYHDDNLQEKVEICSSLKLLEQVEWKKCDHIVLGRFDPIVLKWEVFQKLILQMMVYNCHPIIVFLTNFS